jgi:hypothetical protein
MCLFAKTSTPYRWGTDTTTLLQSTIKNILLSKPYIFSGNNRNKYGYYPKGGGSDDNNDTTDSPTTRTQTFGTIKHKRYLNMHFWQKEKSPNAKPKP